MTLSLSTTPSAPRSGPVALGGRSATGYGAIPVYTGNTPNGAGPASLLSVRRWPVQSFAGRSGACVYGHRWAFTNWYQNPGELDATGGDITVTASVQQTFGGTSPAQLTFNGRPAAIIAPGGTVWSDWCYLPLVAGQDCEVRTYAASANAATLFYASRQIRASLGERMSGYQQLQADATMSASPYAGIASAQDNWPYGPNAAEGLVAGARPNAVAIVGDSVGQGFADVTGGVYGDASGYWGWMERAIGDSYGVVNVSNASKKAADFNANSKRVMSLIAGRCSHVIAELGYNDLNDGSTLAVLQDRMRTMWRTLANAGLKVTAPTFPAVTTSSDGWTTLTGQGQAAGSAWVVGGLASQMNDWLRAGAGGAVGGDVLGVLEVADLMMSGRNSQKWRIDLGAGSPDGVHPSQAVTQAVADGIRPRLLAMLAG